MVSNFFLYGVYDEGQKCFSRFKNFVVQSQPATVKGTLYKLSCGLPLLTSEGDKLIAGTLVELSIPESSWPIIDGLNGYFGPMSKKSFIVRQHVEVMISGQAPVAAQAYGLNPERKFAGCREITDESAYQKLVPEKSLVDTLTERQITYIQKLSQAKGREIVPVDMALYRELMSLELIVDKGRRLALTNLGHEVSLFL